MQRNRSSLLLGGFEDQLLDIISGRHFFGDLLEMRVEGLKIKGIKEEKEEDNRRLSWLIEIKVYDLSGKFIIHFFLLQVNTNVICKGGMRMSFSENLKKKREEKEYTQGELAKLVGVAQAMIAKYEAGIAVPNIVLGVQIAKKLGTTSEELVQ